VPTAVAHFCGVGFLEGVGSGASFFKTQREGDVASRPASLEELTELTALLGLGTTVTAVPPKRP